MTVIRSWENAIADRGDAERLYRAELLVDRENDENAGETSCPGWVTSLDDADLTLADDADAAAAVLASTTARLLIPPTCATDVELTCREPVRR
jgi:hypothetical protein